MRVAIVSAVTGFHREAERVWRTERLASLLDAAGVTAEMSAARRQDRDAFADVFD
jgi:hypothetical protein